MFIALILEVLGVLLSQKPMATALLPFLYTVDHQAPLPGPLGAGLLRYHSRLSQHRRKRPALLRRCCLSLIQLPLVFLLMCLFCSRIQSRSPCCIELSCLPSLLWAMTVNQSFLSIHELESFEEFCRIFLNLSVLFLTVRLV